MRNEVTLWLAEYIQVHNLSPEDISRKLNIPKEKLMTGTKKHLDADECLSLCSYLQIRPESIPVYQGEK